MRKYITILSLLICGICSAQNLSYSSVLPAEGKTAKDIYNSVKAWSATAFTGAKAATQVDNPESCFISFNSNIKYSTNSMMLAAYDGWIHFTLTIQCRDGRYKVEMANISHENRATATKTCQLGMIQADEGAYKSHNKKVADDIKAKTASLFDDLCAGLQEAVKKEAAPAEDDW